jgi:flagellar M-ring protein FliF
MEDSNRVLKELESQGVPYELRGDGSTVLIPKDQVTRARMRLAEAGLPRGGSVGYEIFDKSETLGTTSFVQNVNHLRALEGELARTIRSLDRVSAARVHLVIPERQLFQRDRQEPSASIVLRVRSQLEQAQVRAIRHLAATAVRGLKPERVSIVDEQGRLLADGVGAAEAGIAPMLDERNFSYEQRLKNQLESIVTSIVGPGRARVTVAAELDYTRVQQTSDRYDPESRVVRSTQSREEAAQSDQAAPDDAVTVGNQLPGANQGAGAQQAGNRDSNRKSEEVVNYEISRTTRTEVIEPGPRQAPVGRGAGRRQLHQGCKRRRSDLRTAPAGRNRPHYRPRPLRHRFQRRARRPGRSRQSPLRRSRRHAADHRGRRLHEHAALHHRRHHACGEPAGRGDPFSPRTPLCRPPARSPRRDPGRGSGAALPIAAPEPVLVRQESDTVRPQPPAPLTVPENLATRQIEFAQLQGEVHQQSIQKVGELASRNPYETVSILRQWMHEKTA